MQQNIIRNITCSSRDGKVAPRRLSGHFESACHNNKEIASNLRMCCAIDMDELN